LWLSATAAGELMLFFIINQGGQLIPGHFTFHNVFRPGDPNGTVHINIGGNYYVFMFQDTNKYTYSEFTTDKISKHFKYLDAIAQTGLSIPGQPTYDDLYENIMRDRDKSIDDLLIERGYMLPVSSIIESVDVIIKKNSIDLNLYNKTSYIDTLRLFLKYVINNSNPISIPSRLSTSTYWTGMGGGNYYLKYLKYKQKYLELKNKLN
jgi:hypothetical protein